MLTENELIPVLQMDDREALQAACEHLEKHGYAVRTGPFSELPESLRDDWMIIENGRWLFYLERSRYESGMEMLGEFFGYTGK